MTTRTLIYNSSTNLDCGCLPQPVIICIPSALVAPIDCPPDSEGTYTFNHITGNVTSKIKLSQNCNCIVWQYTLTYDDTQLSSYDAELGTATSPLTASNILGVFCDTGCLITYIDDLVGNPISVVESEEDPGLYILTNQYGCTYEIDGNYCDPGTPQAVVYLGADGCPSEDEPHFAYRYTDPALRLRTDDEQLIIGDISGNARGVNSIDIQNIRDDATQVTSGANSLAFGSRNRVDGDFSIVIGDENEVEASIDEAVVYGIRNFLEVPENSPTYYVTVLGFENTLFNDSTTGDVGDIIQIGHYNTTQFDDFSDNFAQVAVGIGGFNQGDSNVTMGVYCVTEGSGSVSMGYNNSSGNLPGGSTTFDVETVAVGASCDAYGGDQSVAMGSTAFVEADSAVALGSKVLAFSDGAVAVGSEITSLMDGYCYFGTGNDNNFVSISDAGAVGAGTKYPIVSGLHANGDILAADESELGSELVVNGDFSAAGTWTYGTGWSRVTSGTFTNSAQHSNASGAGSLSQAVPISAGSIYRLRIKINQISKFNTNVITVSIGGVTFPDITGRLTSANDLPPYFDVVFTALNTNNLVIACGANILLNVDDISVREILGGDVYALGRIGVNLPELNPNSRLHVNGSLATVTRSVSSADAFNINDYTIIADATGGAFDVDLPSAVGIEGRIYTLKKIDNVANVTLQPDGAETIDGSSSVVLTDEDAVVIVQSDGSNWISLCCGGSGGGGVVSCPDFPEWDGVSATDFAMVQAAMQCIAPDNRVVTQQIGALSGAVTAGSILFSALVEGTNGDLYAIPMSANYIAKIDPVTETVTEFGTPGAGGYKWHGGVLAENGFIYGIPRLDTTVLKIDPSTDTFTTFGALAGGVEKYAGGVLAANGFIYCAPLEATDVLKIDPSTDTVSTFGSLGAGFKYSAAALAPDGTTIYCFPNSSGNILKIDTTTDSVSTISSGLGAQYFGATVAPNGMIYACGNGVPVLQVDPVTDVVSALGLTGSFYGIVVGANGLLCLTPYSGTTYAIIDTSTLQYVTITATGATGALDFSGARVASTGDIFAAPFNTDNFYKIRNSGNDCPEDFRLSRYFNRG